MKRWHTKQEQFLLGSLLVLIGTNFLPALQVAVSHSTLDGETSLAATAPAKIDVAIGKEGSLAEAEVSANPNNSKNLIAKFKGNIEGCGFCGNSDISIDLQDPFDPNNPGQLKLIAKLLEESISNELEKQKASDKAHGGKAKIARRVEEHEPKTLTRLESASSTDEIKQECEIVRNLTKKSSESYRECAEALLKTLANRTGDDKVDSKDLAKLFNTHVKPGFEKLLKDSDNREGQDETLTKLHEFRDDFDGTNGAGVRKAIDKLRLLVVRQDAEAIAKIDQNLKLLPERDPNRMILNQQLMTMRADFENRLSQEDLASNIDAFDLDPLAQNRMMMELYTNFKLPSLQYQQAVWSNDPFQALMRIPPDLNSPINGTTINENGSSWPQSNQNQSGSNLRAQQFGPNTGTSQFPPLNRQNNLANGDRSYFPQNNQSWNQSRFSSSSQNWNNQGQTGVIPTTGFRNVGPNYVGNPGYNGQWTQTYQNGRIATVPQNTSFNAYDPLNPFAFRNSGNQQNAFLQSNALNGLQTGARPRY